MSVSPEAVRYIKLGRGGSWEEAALTNGELHFGYRDAPHELSQTCDRNRIKEYLVERGRAAGAATRDAREICEFYGLGSNCLWITFARDYLWWAYAAPEVTWLGGDGLEHGERTRNTIDGWRNTDINGQPIRINTLSTKLTKVAGYRRTICNVEAEDYLLRRINGEVAPLVAQSMQVQAAMEDVTRKALNELHQDDLETLVDIVFSRTGWYRVSALGKTQKLIDMEFERLTTSARAAVQVKSTASQQTFDEYIDRIEETGRFNDFFFICHTTKGKLVAPPDRPDLRLHLWTGQELAQTVLRLGLQNWLFEKIT